MGKICWFDAGCVTAVLPFLNQFSLRCWILGEVVVFSQRAIVLRQMVFFHAVLRSLRDITVSVAAFVLAEQLRPFRWLGVTGRRFSSADERL